MILIEYNEEEVMDGFKEEAREEEKIAFIKNLLSVGVSDDIIQKAAEIDLAKYDKIKTLIQCEQL